MLDASPRAVAGSGHVHELGFSDGDRLGRAFEQLMASARVEDCLVEPDQLRIRFSAPDEEAARLIERIYRGGGLTRARRYPLRTAR